MTRDDIIRMAKEAGLERNGYWEFDMNRLERFAALIAAAICRVCGRVTEPVQGPVDWLHKWANQDDGEPETQWHDGYEAARRVVQIHLTATPQRPAEPVQEPYALDKKLAEMEAKLNNPSVDDAFRILAEANRRAIDYINQLERQINEYKQTLALQQRSYEREIQIEVEAERQRCADIAEQHASIEGIAQKIAAEIRGQG